MVTPVDNNQVLLTGENSFLRLVQNEGGEYSSRASFWRVSVSPAGPGHALFLESELTGGQPRVYADNLALARWLQREIEIVIHAPNSDLSLPVVEASFGRIGDAATFWTENILTASGDVSLTWFDFMESFIIRPTGVTTKAAASPSTASSSPHSRLASPSTVNTPVAAQHPKTSTANPAVQPASRSRSRGCECDEGNLRSDMIEAPLEQIPTSFVSTNRVFA